MSANNAVVILVTNGDSGPEFRIAHIQALENITYQPDTPEGFNNEVVKNLFGKAPVYHDETKAWRQAINVEAGAGQVEDGIKKLDFSSLPFPS